MTREWRSWHRQYGRDRLLARRLAVVQRLLRQRLDRSPRGRIRLLSLCAGDGRDVVGALDSHPRARDVTGRLVELDPQLAAAARRRAARLGLRRLEVVTGDASTTTACVGAVPADIVLLCGIFGNISDADVENTVRSSPRLCARGATVLWTRGRFAPDLTPRIRRWFADAGFDELAFVPVRGTTASVGAHRFAGTPRRLRTGVRLFTFLPRRARPSTRAARREARTPPRKRHRRPGSPRPGSGRPGRRGRPVRPAPS
jgi:hypothetical protein